VIFNEKSFISGNIEYEYEKITKIVEVKQIKKPLGDVVRFKIYSDQKCIGFDEFSLSDFITLSSKITK